MKNIVHIQKNDLVVSIQDMAKFSNTESRSIENLVRTHSEHFEKLGLVVKQKGKYRDFKSQLFNEPQATFLITLMRNTKKVTDFKISLVMEFYRMREQLCEVNRIQLETAHKEIKHLQLNKRKRYRHGFVALNTYLKENEISLNLDEAFKMLDEYNIVENRMITTDRIFLIDKTFGTQEGHGTIQFNSRSLDLIFRDYIYIEPTLF